MPGIEEAGGIAVVLVARGAVAAAPRAEMESLATLAARMPGISHATYAFTEQGVPSLREVVVALRDRPFAEIRIVPLLLPMEPSFRAWLGRTLARWQTGWDREGPAVRIGPGPISSVHLEGLVADLIDRAGHEPLFDPESHPPVTGSVVSAAQRRVLVCRGGPCSEAGSAVLWGHLRNEQERLGLRTAGRGMMSATTSCLGPCSLAPVVQVWPEGTVYGGLDETGIDRIVAEHLLRDAPVETLAYTADGRKKRLRTP
ncbi:(2Fe-2S) ferredoxin [Methylobacterium gossipiicola]|uniref:(2Fe-2S) ferredoxin n=1 Tax=Methylobacterium gossipiicola TaxID=582675 RepID=A0A1I2X9K0_9HYPH|nr:(2Fe-2S) ferredoxin [Methylobacterium gossipiicola]